MSEGLLTARAVAELLGVSSETVLRWTRRGQLPAIRLPSGALRYRAGELDAWLDSRGVENGPGPRGEVVDHASVPDPAVVLQASTTPQGGEHA